jgi:RimJ/RimL family protein N-acetyltransferase
MNPVPVVLYGDVVRLEPLDVRHAGDLLEAAADPAIWLYMPIPQPNSLEQVRGWIAETSKQATSGDQLPFVIVDAGSDRAIGSTRYLEIRREWRTLEIGWTWLGASAQRTAVNTEAKLLLLQHAFEDLGALRKSRINYDGYVRDSVYYSVIDAEWPVVKRRLQGKLAATR